jgi:MarR family transcriptional regulator for hemolysin
MENLELLPSEKIASIPKFKTENLSIDAILEFYFIDTINLWRNKLDELGKEYDLSRLERRILVYIDLFGFPFIDTVPGGTILL